MLSINLCCPEILSSSEACFLWGIDDSWLRKKVKEFPPGTIRRFGKSYVVTVEGMEKVFGIQKEDPRYSKEDIELAIQKLKKKNLERERNGVHFLINEGYHPVFSNALISMLQGNYPSSLFYSIFQRS